MLGSARGMLFQLTTSFWLSRGVCWSVNEADANSHNEPLQEVRDGLTNGELDADVQDHVIVQRKAAHGEYANEGTESRAIKNATACRVCHRIQHGDHKDRDKDGDHPHGHDALHVILGSIHRRILQELRAQRWQRAKQNATDHEVGNGCAKGCEGDTRVIHPRSASLIDRNFACSYQSSIGLMRSPGVRSARVPW